MAAAIKGKIHRICTFCSMPESVERNFCVDLEIKFTSTSGGIQQAGASETTTLRFHLWLDTSLYFILLLHGA